MQFHSCGTSAMRIHLQAIRLAAAYLTLMSALGLAADSIKPRAVLGETGHKGDIQSVAFSPDSKIVAAADSHGDVTLWDAAAGKKIRTLRAHLDFADAVAFSPDGG